MLCEFFGRCGGCAYLDISYEEELAVKNIFDCVLHPAPSRDAYRNKMEFAFGDEGKDGNLTLGIRKKRSFYEVATPTNCVLIPDDFKTILTQVIKFFREHNETFFHRKKHTGALRHLVLRRGEFTGEILVLLSAASTLQAPLDLFAKNLLSLKLNGNIVGIMHAENDGVADTVKNENIKILHGRDFFYEKICGLQFKISAFSFFQTNSGAAEILYGVVKEFAEASPPHPHSLFEKSEAKTLIGNRASRDSHEKSFEGGLGETSLQKSFPQGLALDLYCGTGTISQIVSPLFEKVIGVEIVEEAILAARENASLNGISNCEFFAGDAFEVLERENIPAPDVIIVDPPRDGLHPKALAKIIALSAKKIIYVACKPKSLMRDLPFFTDAGYVTEKTEAIDMFPYTPHVEVVTVLRSANP
jgi:tRNA/tmRNA/rRNA uracil-C5-methylase (TrmA/RlmC/RlmD family)